jgi:hypothetical protein
MTDTAAHFMIAASASMEDLKPLKESLRAGKDIDLEAHPDAPDAVSFAALQLLVAAHHPLPKAGELATLAARAGLA